MAICDKVKADDLKIMNNFFYKWRQFAVAAAESDQIGAAYSIFLFTTDASSFLFDWDGPPRLGMSLPRAVAAFLAAEVFFRM